MERFHKVKELKIQLKRKEADKNLRKFLLGNIYRFKALCTNTTVEASYSSLLICLRKAVPNPLVNLSTGNKPFDIQFWRFNNLDYHTQSVIKFS